MLIKKSWFEEAENRASDDRLSYLPDLYIKKEKGLIMLVACLSHYHNECAFFQSRQAIDGFIKSLIRARDTVFN